MFVYANLLGSWTELPDDTVIDNTSLKDFAISLITDKIEQSFVEIKLPNNTLHLVHISQIQLSKRN